MSDTVPTTRRSPEVGSVTAPSAPLPFWRRTARGFSQCAFQANEVTGLLFIAAAAAFNWRMGVFFVLSVVLGTATAVALRADAGLLDLGLFGFNSGLMGLALGNFFHPDAALWVAVVVLAVVVAALTVAMARWVPFPFLAAPFIVLFWVLWPLATTLHLDVVELGAFGTSQPEFLKGTVVALGSTLFAAGVVPGVLFLAGIAVANWRHAVVAVLGAAIGISLAIHVGVPGDAINSGFIGFNAVLAAVAAYVVIAEDLRMSVLAAVLATWIFSVINRNAPFPALASGFVLTIWGLLLLALINPWFTGRSTAARAG